MSRAVFEPMVGVINGFNKIFETSQAYIAGSVAVTNNIILGHDQFRELGNKRIELVEAPQPGDEPRAWYRPA